MIPSRYVTLALKVAALATAVVLDPAWSVITAEDPLKLCPAIATTVQVMLLPESTCTYSDAALVDRHTLESEVFAMLVAG